MFKSVVKFPFVISPPGRGKSHIVHKYRTYFRKNKISNIFKVR